MHAHGEVIQSSPCFGGHVVHVDTAVNAIRDAFAERFTSDDVELAFDEDGRPHTAARGGKGRDGGV